MFKLVLTCPNLSDYVQKNPNISKFVQTFPNKSKHFSLIYIISAYHPFYITDDKEGGYQYKTTSQRRKTKVFSGIENNRLSGATPTGIGRLCEWREDPQQPADSFSSFGAYQVITEGYN